MLSVMLPLQIMCQYTLIDFAELLQRQIVQVALMTAFPPALVYTLPVTHLPSAGCQQHGDACFFCATLQSGKLLQRKILRWLHASSTKHPPVT